MSDKRAPWLKWYPADWRADPRLRMCSLAARGLWIEILGFMHEAERYGFLLIAGIAPSPEEIAVLVGAPAALVRKALDELESRGVYSRDDEGVIYSRRMVRDKAKAEEDRRNGLGGGNPDLIRGTVSKAERSRPYKRSDSPQKTRRIFDACGGRCHWCRAEVAWEIFHVDHLRAIRDGGDHAEENLVASCPDCNHKRAREEIPTPSQCTCRKTHEVTVGLFADDKAQRLEARDQRPEKEDSASGKPRGDLTAKQLEEFEAWWQHYPKRVARKEAERAFLKARKTATLEQLIAGAKRYAASITDPKFTAHPATWLNQGRWEDEPPPSGPHGPNGFAVSKQRSPRSPPPTLDRQQLRPDEHDG